jgi:hypothetical protein
MIGGGGNLRAPGFQFPVEVRADISASLGTTPADELRLDFGQPNVIRPSVGAHGCPVAALVIRAIDQETANASGPHFSEGDLLAGEFGHAPFKRGLSRQAIGHPGDERRWRPAQANEVR